MKRKEIKYKLNLNLKVSTSTLSIGVNLPAHLVIIKSTMYYSSSQTLCEYSPSQILQMMGRAGRPQFDRSATAVIMTKQNDKVNEISKKKTIKTKTN